MYLIHIAGGFSVTSTRVYVPISRENEEALFAGRGEKDAGHLQQRARRAFQPAFTSKATDSR